MSALIGKILANRYRVDSFLDRGGMAEVYKVWDRDRMTFLAMKVLHEDLALERDFIRRFTREANTLSKLKHDNIVRFFDFEKQGRLAFILMEYIKGGTLKHLLHDADGKSMPFGQIRVITRSTCSALYYAHNQGYVHCDIKPANIMINQNGIVQLADFGIARMSDAVTTTMVGAGTSAYMAPEQVRGLDPVPQTDIYALGVVLFEMFTGGERPFTGDQAQTTGGTSERVRWEQIHLPPPSPRQWDPSLSNEIEAVILKCLAKNPNKRYGGALELVNALELALGDEQDETPFIFAPPLSPTPLPPTPKPKMNKGVIAAGIGLFTIILIGFGWLIGGGIPKKPSTSTSPPILFTLALTNTSLPESEPSLVSSTPTYTTVPTSSPEPTSTHIPVDNTVMIYVPAGDFPMGSGSSSPKKEQPQHIVFLDAFWIDQTEITNIKFEIFINETAYKTDSEKRGESWVYSGGKWLEQTGAYWSQPNGSGSNLRGKSEHPAVHISWNDAYAYCAWRGGRLPTEAEWEKAARGTTASSYPWGNASPSPQYLNYNLSIRDTVAVGSYPQGASPYNIYDLSGNVWEWVSDWYGENYYQVSPSSNPQGPSSGNKRVFRGGSWDDISSAVTATVRVGYNPSVTSSSIGFRCAKNE